MSIKTDAQIIRDEKVKGANTATRVGSNLVAIADDLIAKDLALDGKQTTLISGANIKTINGSSLLGSGDIVIDADDIDDSLTSHKFVTSADITKLGNLSGTNTGDQDLSSYLTISSASSTYEPLKGANDNYVTDAEKIVIGNTSGTNTGDQDLSPLETRIDNLEENQYSGVVVYETLASLPATGTVNTSYKVSNDSTSSNNGYYHWNGSAYVKDADLANGLVASGNVDAVSGGTVFDGILFEKYKDINVYSLYNGLSSQTVFSETFTLQDIGDYVEFIVDIPAWSSSKSMGILGEIGTSTSNIGFWSDGKLYVRNSTGTWLTQNGLDNESYLNAEMKIKLLWVSGGIEIYLNDNFIETITTGIVKINNIGRAYSGWFEGKIRNINISHTSGTLKSIKTPYLESGYTSTNVTTESTDNVYLTETQGQELEFNTFVVNNILNSYKTNTNYYTRFNGTTSNCILSNTYILANDGDYFEITMRRYENSSLRSLGAIGQLSYTNTFGFELDELWFRSSGDTTYHTVSGLTGFNEFKTYKVIVINSGTQFEIFQDGISVATITKNGDFYINNIGDAYPTYKPFLDVKNVIIHTSLSDFNEEIIYFSNKTEAVNTDLELVLDVRAELFKPCYVSYDPTGYLGNEIFTAYVQNESNPNYYFGFNVVRLIDATDLKYENQYRLLTAYVYAFDGTTMTATGEGVLQGGESEFVYKEDGRDDFVGGYHGDEQLTEINFFIDGVRLSASDLSTSFDLVACKEFSYIQKSTMHEASTSGIPNLSHPIQALHHKHTIFRNSSYETNNRIIWQSSISCAILYFGISSIETDFGGFGYVTDDYVIETFDQSDTDRLVGIYNNAQMWNETNGNSVSVYTESDVYESTGSQKIWDISTYNKYYRTPPAFTSVIGDEANSKMIVKFLKK